MRKAEKATLSAKGIGVATTLVPARRSLTTGISVKTDVARASQKRANHSMDTRDLGKADCVDNSRIKTGIMMSELMMSELTMKDGLSPERILLMGFASFSNDICSPTIPMLVSAKVNSTKPNMPELSLTLPFGVQIVEGLVHRLPKPLLEASGVEADELLVEARNGIIVRRHGRESLGRVFALGRD
jgi:hypothetical protein